MEVKNYNNLEFFYKGEIKWTKEVECDKVLEERNYLKVIEYRKIFDKIQKLEKQKEEMCKKIKVFF